MGTAVNGVVATVSLFLTVASLFAAPAGGVVFTPFLIGLFLLALVGVFGGIDDRRVRRRSLALAGKRWRNGP